jgi:LPXTG-motif cell wall-anchored protein
MKKIIIFFSALFLVNTVFGQAFKPVKMDSLVTISLPAVHGQKDTLGQQIFSGTTDLGYMIAIREPNAKNNQPLKKEKDLNSVLKKYILDIQSQSGGGSAQFVRDTTVGTLKAKEFTLVMKDANGDIQYRRFLLIYTLDATYTFEYGYPESRKELVKDEPKAFFSSIKLSPDLQRNDQYTDTSKSTGISTNLIIAIAGGVVLILGIIWLIFRKKKDNSEFAS